MGNLREKDESFMYVPLCVSLTMSEFTSKIVMLFVHCSDSVFKLLLISHCAALTRFFAPVCESCSILVCVCMCVCVCVCVSKQHIIIERLYCTASYRYMCLL